MDVLPTLDVPDTVFIRRRFTVTLKVSAEWREKHALTAEDLWMSGTRVVVSLEGTPTGAVIGSCPRCCPESRACIQVNGTTYQQFGPHRDPEDERVELFCFDNCKSFCTSSRLHFGASFVLRVELVRRADCAVLGVAMSLPFTTCSRVPRRVPKAPKDLYQSFTDMSPIVERVEVSPSGLRKKVDPERGVPVLIHLNAPAETPRAQESIPEPQSQRPSEPLWASSMFGLQTANYEDIIEEYYAMFYKNQVEEWLRQEDMNVSPMLLEDYSQSDTPCTTTTAGSNPLEDEATLESD